MKLSMLNPIKALVLTGLAGLLLATTGHSAVLEGNVAIIRVNGNTDGFSVLALTNLSAGDTLYFTDAAWQNGGGFSGTEGAGTTDILTSDIAAGSVFDISTSSLNASGEQVFLFTGTKTSPTLVAGIDWGNSGWITTGATASDTSYAPNQGTGALTSSLDFLAVGTSAAAAKYNGTFSGSVDDLRTAISNPANWVTTADTSWTGGSFTVTAAPEPATFGIVLFGGAILFVRRRHLLS
ncbi:MAG: hypothetical protein QM796_19505 [Chthoniobacteraceae bacterium]